MESIAKYDYEATTDGELSFRKGQCLKVMQTTGNWYKAELNEFEGYVPKNFIDMVLPSWYQEDISRSEAEKKLMSHYVGAFLIRASQQHGRGNFSISVRHEKDVQHFKVMRDSRWQYYLWSKKFPSLNQLVEYYRKNSINKEEQLFLRDIPPPQPQQQQRRGSNIVLPLPKPAPRSDPSPVQCPVPIPVKSPVLSPERKPARRNAPKPDPSPVQSPVLSHTPKLAPRPDPSPVQCPVPIFVKSPVLSPERKPARRNAPKPDPSPAPKSDPSPVPRPDPRPDPRLAPSPAPRPDPRPDPSPVRGPAPSPEPAPRPVPAPRQHKAFMPQVKALYDFEAEEKDELDFTAGDVIKVLECSHDNWWKGQLRGKIGLFPSNYTKPI